MNKTCVFLERCGIAALAVFSITLTGCPSAGGGGGGDDGGGGGGNSAPTADAGADQFVTGGDFVQLDGAGSSDSDADTLTFAWSQTDGPSVDLSGAGSAAASFTAPSVNDSLTFQLAVDDGNGGTDTDTVVINVSTDPSVLFVVNNNARITSYSNPGGLNGDVEPSTSLPVGSVTGIFQPRSIVLTRNDVLLISSQNDAIVGYEDGFGSTGATLVDRTIEGSNTLLSTPISFAYDEINDRLFVGNANADDGVLVFDDVSALDFDGNSAPDRNFGPTDRFPFGTSVSITSTFDAMDLDADGNLYASDTSGLNGNQSRILVFTDPGAADGGIEAPRSFTSDSWGNIEDIVITDGDVLLVVDGEDAVYIFNDASTLSGDVDPSAVLTVPITRARLDGILVSSTGMGFVADRENFAIYAFDDIESLSGSLVPDRAIEGNATELRNPRQMFLFEPE